VFESETAVIAVVEAALDSEITVIVVMDAAVDGMCELAIRVTVVGEAAVNKCL
jgi:hypothetical protein